MHARSQHQQDKHSFATCEILMYLTKQRRSKKYNAQQNGDEDLVVFLGIDTASTHGEEFAFLGRSLFTLPYK